MSKTHLIIVPGHSIYNPSTPFSKGQHSNDWFLESFQKEGQDHLIFIKHVEKGIQTLKSSQNNSVLVLSGGQTKRQAGPKSESYSYYQVAEDLGLLEEGLRTDIYLEEFARDSFENVLFSISRFYEVVGAYPRFITIVGFEFKRYRFLELHLKRALRWNISNVEYIGIDPIPPYEEGSIEHKTYFDDLAHSEKKFAVQFFEVDLLGNGTKLGGKKATRNPFNRFHGYQLTNPLLIPFFQDSLDGSTTAPWE